MKPSEDNTASRQIDDIIASHGGWKAETLSHIRAAILAANPEVTEEVKWKMPSRPLGLPVWSHGGTLCFAEIWKDNIKLLFSKGAHMDKQQHLFNARLKSLDIRAVEFKEGDAVNDDILQTLVREAIRLQRS